MVVFLYLKMTNGNYKKIYNHKLCQSPKTLMKFINLIINHF